MNTEERQLADMLRRVAPEPPGRVTVEDVAFRLANQAAGPGHRRHREPRAQRAWGRGWAPALAAASVIVVAGASAGIATVVTSHRGPASSGGGTTSSPSVSTSASSPASSPAPSQVPTSVQPSWPPERVASGMWGAELINRDTFTQDSLTSGDGSLYATDAGNLARIDPANGNVLASVPYGESVPGAPVITGSTVWVLSQYAGTSVVLHGYDAKTLAQVASVTVPVSGQVSSTAGGVLTAGPNGYLYVAAGSNVAVLNPGTRQVIKQISVPAGPVNSVAVAPDGSKLYVSVGPFQLLTYNPATGTELGGSAIADLTTTAGNLVATSGGVWGTTGVGMTESAWFAPGGNLTRMIRIGAGAGAGLSSVPTLSGGTVWIGGSHNLVCASPVTGQVLASATIPTDGAVVEYFGSVTVLAGHAYAYYQDQRAQQFGVATLTPPGACSG